MPTESFGAVINVCVRFRGVKMESVTSVLKSLPVMRSAINESSTNPRSEYTGVVNGAKDGGSFASPWNNCSRVHVGLVPHGGKDVSGRGGKPKAYKSVMLTR